MHIKQSAIRGIFLNLSERAVEALDMKDEDFGQFNEQVPHFGFGLFIATFTSVVVVQ